MQPEFGCDIYKILFEPNTNDTIFEDKIESLITNAVNLWLPYINVDRINYYSTDDEIDRHIVNIEIQFSLVSNPNLSDSTKITINS
jgi:phage baseplate assembly protein W